MRSVRRAERWSSALFVLGGLAGLLCLAWKSPQAWGIPPCPFYFLTGLFCPGCGTLRATHSLLQGDVHRAFAFNPLLVLLLPYLGAVGLNEALAAVTGKKWQGSARWRPLWGWSVLSIVLAFWLLRNLPGERFDVLRPGGGVYHSSQGAQP